MQKTMYDLTNPQKSIWFTEQFYKGSCINNVCGTVFIKEEFDLEKLEQALNIFVKNNDSFRIRITLDKDGNPKQYISDFSNFELDCFLFDSIEELRNLEHSMVNTPFSLIDSPLFVINMFKLPNNNGGFVVNAHHLISDARTAGLVANKVMNIYSSLVKNEEITEISTSYVDYINSENEYLNSNKFKNDKLYWENCFETVPEIASLCPYNLDADTTNCKAKRESFTLEKNLIDNINVFCKNINVSPFNFFMSVFAIYIGKVKNLKDFVIGSPILNRTTYKEKNTCGMFISTVPFPFSLEKDLLFKDFIINTSTHTMGMFRHQKYPYHEILRYLRQKDNSIPNLYNIMISYQNTKIDKYNLTVDYEVNWTHSEYTNDELDIHLFDMNDFGSLTIAYDYQINKYNPEDIQQLHSRILYIIEQILLCNGNLKLETLKLITIEEEQNLLRSYTSMPTTITKTVIDLLEEQVIKNPNNIAISDKKTSLTYREFYELCNKYSLFLKQHGVCPNDKICLFYNNSIDLLLSIISALKCGACYIPIDITYPIKRIEYIVKDSKCKYILTNKKNQDKLLELSNISLCMDLNTLKGLANQTDNINNCNLSNLAYIIYTSGSTGKPKGVKIAHESLSNYILWANEVYVKGEKTNFPLYSSISFDLTVTSVFTPLISGNSIFIYENENPQLLFKDMITQNKVQIIKLTPAHLTLLMDYLPHSNITKLIVGGDILNNEICKKITNSCDHSIAIYNEYGPTEATVGCMIYKYNEKDKIYSSVPIGIPANNVNLYILNEDLNLLPYKYNGELYIGGKCLSKGYINSPQMTSDKFINSPFISEDILYKTGDIVKSYPNNIMEYIGRKDFQVKINGFRIEIGEIQSKVLNYSNIKDCYIHVLENNNVKSLCAYYVCKENETVSLKLLKQYLRKQLPNYMIPTYFVLLEKIPLTTNGKVDKSLLPLPTSKNNSAYIKPNGVIEQQLHDDFCSVLGIDKISVTANFFDYYVDSLVLIKLQTIFDQQGIYINTQSFYENPSIRSLAKYICNKEIEKSSHTDLYLNLSNIKKSINKSQNNYKNILLFGSTGFLGIHLLHDILLNTNAHIYCIIRNKNNLDAIQRFENKFKFYFDEESFNKYTNRITIITGNIYENQFSLSESQYTALGKQIDCVINSAALVKHYGNYEDFYATNVIGTKNIVYFCKTFDIPLHYISTMSVSGYGLVQTPSCVFDEDSFYIEQKFEDNVYVKSKLQAERIIIEACNKQEIIGSIYRMGNITNRYTDGSFQENATENAFLNRIISIIKLSEIPSVLKDIPLEFTPVDYCSYFIFKLLNYMPNNLNIFHLYNENTINLNNLLIILKEKNIFIRTVSIEDFQKHIENSNDSHFGIINYISNIKNNEFNLVNLSNIKTNQILKNLGLQWPSITKEYLEKIFLYLQKNKFIGDE